MVMQMSKQLRWRGALALAVLMAGMGPAVAAADEGDESEPAAVELTERQLELNNDAIMALREDPPDTERAISLTRAALVSGEEANLLYVTLGRAYQVAGMCDEAFEALEAAEGAPNVVGVAEEQIRARLRTYVDDLEEACPSTLVVHCADPETQLFAEGIGAIECDTEVAATPGEYRVEASVEDMSTTVNITLRGGRDASVEIGLDGRRRRGGRALERALSRTERALEVSVREQLRAFEERQQEDDEDEELPMLPPVAEEEELPPMEGFHYQTVLNVPFGAYTVQAGDGAVDAGLVVGGGLQAQAGWAFTEALGIEGHFRFAYRHGLPLAVKYLEDQQERHEISYRSLDFTGDIRTWLEFFGLGFFVDYRRQKMVFPDGEFYSPATLLGPSLTLSAGGIARGQRDYRELTVRWAPLGAGDLSMFSASAQFATGYAIFGIEAAQLTGRQPDSAVRGGEYLMVNLGVRVAGLISPPRGIEEDL